MHSIQKHITKDTNWDARLESLNPPTKHIAKRQMTHKLRQKQKIEVKKMSEVCVCCGKTLGDAELGIMICEDCRIQNNKIQYN